MSDEQSKIIRVDPNEKFPGNTLEYCDRSNPNLALALHEYLTQRSGLTMGSSDWALISEAYWRIKTW